MNRRNRLRFRTDLSAKVSCIDDPGTSLKGRLTNLSAHGLSLILSRELPVGTAVNVEWGSTKIVGEVIYCQTSGAEFIVGLRVEDPVYDATNPPRDESHVV